MGQCGSEYSVVILQVGQNTLIELSLACPMEVEGEVNNGIH